MGPQAEDIFKTFKLEPDDKEKFEAVLKEYEAYFVPRRNIIYERVKFNTRTQQDGESVEDFVTALHALAATCDYGQLREDLIRDRLVVGIQDHKISRALQLDPDLNLQKAVLVARQHETINQQQVELHRVREQDVHHIQSQRRMSSCEDVYVLQGLRTPLLGKPAIERLGVLPQVNVVKKLEPESDFPQVFQGLGTFKEEYDLKLNPDSKPFALSSPRRVRLPLYEKTRQELERMQALGVISPVTEPTTWCAPMVVVPKPSGAVRICVDFTELNRYVQREWHPIPAVEYTIGMLRGASMFSKLDANSGFWQIPLSERSKVFTTFITPFGLFYFNRLPFGISTAPEHFQRRMGQVLCGQEGVVCHMDDVLIWGATQAQHDERLRAVMDRLRTSGITLNREKCEFGVT
ncbi:uncharacterized protein K02A2.6-like [Rhipicephalus sanguineus]|uniref:uncharacterized protein K02A2.6-like n=1 Tax=Rhipicephalus sanguineus TaxID=34632 RepID=UPI0020C39DBA|nr:uncharacterized protein K02A2.6-like [Rhipicephalus sanguineus]